MLLRNLLENAVKYTPIEGRVDIAITQRDDAVELTVDDSGPGLPPAERERVLDRFYRSGLVAELPLRTIAAQRTTQAISRGERGRRIGPALPLHIIRTGADVVADARKPRADQGGIGFLAQAQGDVDALGNQVGDGVRQQQIDFQRRIGFA